MNIELTDICTETDLAPPICASEEIENALPFDFMERQDRKNLQGVRRLRIASPDPRHPHPNVLPANKPLEAARQKIDQLEKDNERLRRKAVRLAQMAASSRHHAYHDELTGLPTRRLLIDRCRQAMAQARRQHKQVGLMMLDLNGFKKINDCFGHDAGDDVLRHVARCLLSCTRRGDTVCRYGGDEFVIMLPELDSHERMATLSAKIHTRLSIRYVEQGASIAIATSVGMAIFPADGDSFRTLMKQADIGMYWAKFNDAPQIVPR